MGVDVTPAQLETARRLQAKTGIEFPLLEANAEEVPLSDATFDVALSEYGASIWCDPYRWIPEAARLLRPGGELVFLRNSTLSMLCAALDGWHENLQRPQRGLNRIDWEDDGTTEFHLPLGELFALLREAGFDVLEIKELYAPADAGKAEYYHSDRSGGSAGRGRRSGGRGGGERARRRPDPARVDESSTSLDPGAARPPVRRRRPRLRGARPAGRRRLRLVREHARGKARSVAQLGGAHRPVLGVDTAVAVDGAILGKPANAAEAERMLERLAGKTHVVVSGLCLLTPAWEVVEHEEGRASPSGS